MCRVTAVKRSPRNLDGWIRRNNPIAALLRTQRPLRTLLLLSFNVLMIVAIARLRRVVVHDGEIIGKKFEQPSRDDAQRRPENAPLVAIVSCIKSGAYAPKYFIENVLLPSIHETVTEEERAAYRVELILGYDHDDEYWREEGNRVLSSPPGGYDRGEPIIPTSFVSIRKDPHGDRPNRIPFNELCRAAFDYGASYIARINDDSEFKSRGWITVATAALRAFDPPDVGVVGPTCHQGNTDIMTHDFVHAPSHYSIFDTYYPREFDNYYVDDWISNVYGMRRTEKLGNWEVEHHLQTFWTRYEPTFDQDQLLDELVREGRGLVEKSVLEKKKMDRYGVDESIKRQRDDLQVLGTETIERVDGPMEKLHLSLMGNNSTR